MLYISFKSDTCDFLKIKKCVVRTNRFFGIELHLFHPEIEHTYRPLVSRLKYFHDVCYVYCISFKSDTCDFLKMKTVRRQNLPIFWN